MAKIHKLIGVQLLNIGTKCILVLRINNHDIEINSGFSHKSFLSIFIIYIIYIDIQFICIFVNQTNVVNTLYEIYMQYCAMANTHTHTRSAREYDTFNEINSEFEYDKIQLNFWHYNWH